MNRYQAQEAAFLRAHGIALSIQRNLNVLFNGFAALVPRNQLARLRALTNVAAILPDRKLVPMLDHSLSLVNVPQAWADLGGQAKAGRNCQGAGKALQGCYIALLDTGVDISNPCFSDKGFARPALTSRGDPWNQKFTNNKIILARAFGQNQLTHYSAQDSNGHGTFNAAIMGCDANTPTPLGTEISGVSPGAYIMNYDVFPNTGGTDSGFQDPVIAALSAALDDGADVANMSLGFPFQVGDPSLDPDTQAIEIATKAGLNVVVAAGNSGPTPQSVSSPGTAPDAISVGATTNSRTIAASIEVAGSGTPPASIQRPEARVGNHAFASPIGPYQTVFVGLGRRPNDDSTDLKADDFAGKDLHGKIAVIDRGLITFATKISNAAAAGAVGVLLIDNQSEIDLPNFDMGSATLPTMMISLQAGSALKKWLQSNPSATITLDPTKAVTPLTPDVLSDFSARGYGPGYLVKPDMVAPGQGIYSATETDDPTGEQYDPSGFTLDEGTSFAAPHVAGSVTLVLQKHPTWTPAQVKDDLTETAAAAAVTVPGSTIPSVMQIGSGLLDDGAALEASALAQPSSFTLGEVNVAGAAASQTENLSLSDVGGGSGAWTVSVDALHGDPGVAVSVPGSVQLASGGHVAVPVKFAISQSTPSGDYDGYIMLQQGGQQLHVPYFLHVTNGAVTPGSVLLVDDSLSRFQPPAPLAPLKPLDVAHYYEQALAAIGRKYSYWNVAQLGPPGLADMKKASAVIYYTANNLNMYSHAASNPNGFLGPLSSPAITALHQYLNGGGRVFLTGMGVAITDLTFSAIVLGGNVQGLSEYDNPSNDKNQVGGLSPPQPSAVVDSLAATPENRWLFSGMKGIDFSTKGDGAGDNVAQQNTPLQGLALGLTPSELVGVPGMKPYSGTDPFFGDSFGKAVLRTTDLQHAEGADVGIASSDDPSLKHVAKYPGRSILFSFGFEGINDNTGYATRAQVLSRIFQWFGDSPTAKVAAVRYVSRRAVQLRASFKAGPGVHAVQYQWQVGKTVLKATSKAQTYRFPHAGSYRLRVQITDSVGHSAVSDWKTVRVS